MPNLYRASFPQNKEYENREEKNPPKNNKQNPKNKKKKTDFKTMKKNTIKSLNDVEYFLNNFGEFIKYAKIYNYIKKRNK